MYKAVFLDLDGTLLRQDHSISLETRDTIHRLTSQGILVVLVSARPFHGITPIYDWLGIESLPVVSLNGAYIALDNKVIFASSIDLETISAIHGHTRDFAVTPIYYTGLQWHAETRNAAVIKEQRITEVEVTIAPFGTLMQGWKHQDSGINKVMVIGEEHVISELEDALLPVYAGRLNIYTSKPTYLEIMRKDASKTNAVKFLINRYDIKKEEVIAIGDNFNDKEMIEFAGTGIAMGNAPDAIKAVADYVTDTNENDGVRKAIEKFVWG